MSCNIFSSGGYVQTFNALRHLYCFMLKSVLKCLLLWVQILQNWSNNSIVAIRILFASINSQDLLFEPENILFEHTPQSIKSSKNAQIIIHR